MPSNFSLDLGTDNLKGLPTEDQLASMEMLDIEALRRENKTNPEIQKYLAPYEHRAFAREVGSQDFLAAIGLSTAAPTGYAAIKSAGGMRGEETSGPATPPSIKQVQQGMLGGLEGMGEYITKGFAETLGIDVVDRYTTTKKETK